PPSMAGLPRRLEGRSLPHELGRTGVARWPLLRADRGILDHRSRATALDLRGGVIIRPLCKVHAPLLFDEGPRRRSSRPSSPPARRAAAVRSPPSNCNPRAAGRPARHRAPCSWASGIWPRPRVGSLWPRARRHCPIVVGTVHHRQGVSHMDLITLVTACAFVVEPKLMHALIWHQSGGEPWAVSVQGEPNPRVYSSMQEAIRETRASSGGSGTARVGLGGLGFDPSKVPPPLSLPSRNA